MKRDGLNDLINSFILKQNLGPFEKLFLILSKNIVMNNNFTLHLFQA